MQDNSNYYTNVCPKDFLNEKSLNKLEAEPKKLGFWLTADKFINFTLSSIARGVKFIGMVADHGINALSKLISIKIGLFDTSKVHLCEEIQRLEGELSETKLRNKRLDAENYILFNAIGELEVGGNLAYDKCVQWFGETSEPAVRWRDALSRSNAARGFFYEEASEYYGVRCNNEWMREYNAKKKDGEHKVRPSSKRKRKR